MMNNPQIATEQGQAQALTAPPRNRSLRTGVIPAKAGIHVQTTTAVKIIRL
jgi:hypothetical protein